MLSFVSRRLFGGGIPMNRKLSHKTITQLKSHEFYKQWSIGEDKMTKKIEFKNFDDAFDFMKLVAEKSKVMDHHPEWFNVYNRVNITLNTHDAQGLTKNDMVLAQYINISEATVKQQDNASFQGIEELLHQQKLVELIDKIEKA